MTNEGIKARLYKLAIYEYESSTDNGSNWYNINKDRLVEILADYFPTALIRINEGETIQIINSLYRRKKEK